MPAHKLAILILAAGKSARMKSSVPKVLHAVGGRSLIDHVLATANSLAPDEVHVVLGKDMDLVASHIGGVPSIVQDPPMGTAHAVLSARGALGNFSGDLLVLYGDTPLLQANTLERLRKAIAGSDGPAAAVLGFRPDDPAHYGRLVTRGDGVLEAIIEYKDASADERQISLCNSGVMVLDAPACWDWLEQIENKNAAGEYYLTDLVAIARAAGRHTVVVEGSAGEMLGVNSRADLAAAEQAFQRQARGRHMDAGVTLRDPESVYLCHDTKLGRDVTIGPHVVFGPNVVVEDGATIEAFSHIEGAHIASGAQVGPFARLRPGADIGRRAKIGNFVEVKKATIEEGAKASHLSYIGDARIGAEANIGAGTITCNYDGFSKHYTDVGAGAFIGSNTALVAPVKIGDGAIIGAGSTVTKDVEADALAVSRAGQKSIPSGATRFRNKNVKRD